MLQSGSNCVRSSNDDWWWCWRPNRAIELYAVVTNGAVVTVQAGPSNCLFTFPATNVSPYVLFLPPLFPKGESMEINGKCRDVHTPWGDSAPRKLLILLLIVHVQVNLFPHLYSLPIAVAARSKARTVFARSNTEIMSSNPTEAWMFVCVLYAFFLFLHSLKWDSQPT
jgi:hypothetical protein